MNFCGYGCNFWGKVILYVLRTVEMWKYGLRELGGWEKPGTKTVAVGALWPRETILALKPTLKWTRYRYSLWAEPSTVVCKVCVLSYIQDKQALREPLRPRWKSLDLDSSLFLWEFSFCFDRWKTRFFWFEWNWRWCFESDPPYLSSESRGAMSYESDFIW